MGWLRTITLSTQVGNRLPPIAPTEWELPKAPAPMLHIGTPIPKPYPGAPMSNAPGFVPPAVVQIPLPP